MIGETVIDTKQYLHAVRASENQISSIVSEINLEMKIGRLKKDHEKAGESKQEIKKSVEFWQLFKQASERGANCTSLLQKILISRMRKGTIEHFTVVVAGVLQQHFWSMGRHEIHGQRG